MPSSVPPSQSQAESEAVVNTISSSSLSLAITAQEDSVAAPANESGGAVSAVKVALIKEKRKQIKNAVTKARQANAAVAAVKEQIRYGSRHSLAQVGRVKRKADEHKAKIDAGPAARTDKYFRRNRGRRIEKGHQINMINFEVEKVVLIKAKTATDWKDKACMSAVCKKGFKATDIVFIRSLAGHRLEKAKADELAVHEVQHRYVHLGCMTQRQLSFFQKRHKGKALVDHAKIEGLDDLPDSIMKRVKSRILNAHPSKGKKVLSEKETKEHRQKCRAAQKKARSERHHKAKKAKTGTDLADTAGTSMGNAMVHEALVEAAVAQAADL
ncbi:uncharacterized protein LAESUDRAFT_94624 [Laetiporus sulphureus 93-53]|uniref:Uncharacterized protein n=1 Tax=Laetiporus sulphureus 93-53 TaxID=1314785 RepID=A0A165ATY1_9APHY|nr:uncharacterized protein LAESUDRAFT_94624 [Laetiporus sulphureus 93-53]KZS99656.1 hypothetical protein LAESUDRAFT_94624 [Laetiporus sulphureus 93-53]